MTKRLPMLLTVAALSVFAAACGEDEQEPAAADAATATETATPEPMQASQDIVAVAQGNERLSTLVDAVTAADLGSTLEGEGPYTVFAPTDQAFGALPDGTLDTLLMPENRDQLREVLTYHVVEGDVMAADLSDGQRIETVQGQQLRVSIDGDRVMVGDATVVQPDVDASNGTVHVIDSVLRPQT